MTGKRNRSDKKKAARRATAAVETPLRIIGGKFRGSRIEYSGDRSTRPMKDRVREAAFNLVGPAVKGKFVIDLFAGTGALGLESISRGAAGALFIERQFPAARVIEQNAAHLGISEIVDVLAADTFIWGRKFSENREPETKPWPDEKSPWLVFCSPPYDFYVERTEDLLKLIQILINKAPDGSLFLVESDDRFDFSCLPQEESWDVRTYSPAVLGIMEVVKNNAASKKE